MFNNRDLASAIDHTILNPQADLDAVNKLIDQAIEYQFAAVCVNPIFVIHTNHRLRQANSKVNNCTVVGFPLGANTVATKIAEAQQAARDGATEIDIVSHLPYLLDADIEKITDELKPIIQAAKEINSDIQIKVIVESALLLKDVDSQKASQRIAAACVAIKQAGGDYIKTSTGFHPAGGASIEAVKLMVKFADGLKTKAAGGIRTLKDAESYLALGVNRIGCSASVAIMNELQSQ